VGKGSKKMMGVFAGQYKPELFLGKCQMTVDGWTKTTQMNGESK